MATPTLEDLKAEYDAAYKTRKKNSERWSDAKHKYREAERAASGGQTSTPGSPVAQTAEASAEQE